MNKEKKKRLILLAVMKLPSCLHRNKLMDSTSLISEPKFWLCWDDEKKHDDSHYCSCIIHSSTPKKKAD